MPDSDSDLSAPEQELKMPDQPMLALAIQAWGNLLAVILKDRHYMSHYGWEKAQADALLEIFAMRARIDELEQAIRTAVRQHGSKALLASVLGRAR